MWSLRTEIRTRVGSAGLVLDAPVSHVLVDKPCTKPAGEETAWSLRAEIRTRMGSAALVLDVPATSTQDT